MNAAISHFNLPRASGSRRVGRLNVAGVVVDGEAGQVERVLVAGLPAGVGRQRTDQLDAVVVVGGKDLPDADIAGVDQMNLGQQVVAGEVGVAALDGVQVGGGGVGGGHVGDQMGPVRLTGLGEVAL